MNSDIPLSQKFIFVDVKETSNFSSHAQYVTLLRLVETDKRVSPLACKEFT
jgi:hypothetical protein